MAKEYQIVLGDPPWTYNDKAQAGKRGACHKYPTMNTADICALNVQSFCAKDAVLFLWATGPMMPVALDVMAHWGFVYKSIAFTWVKRTKNNKLHWGMGSWTRANPEFVLLGVRGKPKRVSAGVHSVLEEPLGAHSAKPLFVRDKIVQLMGDLPRVELFARDRVDGWDAWGNEVDSDIDLRPRAHFNPVEAKSDEQIAMKLDGDKDGPS